MRAITILFLVLLVSCAPPNVFHGKRISYVQFIKSDNSSISIPMLENGAPLQLWDDGSIGDQHKTFGIVYAFGISGKMPDSTNNLVLYSFGVNVKRKISISRILVESIGKTASGIPDLLKDTPEMIGNTFAVDYETRIPVNETSIPWLFIPGETRFLYKITIFERSGKIHYCYLPLSETWQQKSSYINNSRKLLPSSK